MKGDSDVDNAAVKSIDPDWCSLHLFVFRLFPLQGSRPYLLTVGQDFTGFFEATLASLRIWLPLASLKVHVQHLTATEHGNLGFCHLGAWSIHLRHGQSLENIGGWGETCGR